MEYIDFTCKVLSGMFWPLILFLIPLLITTFWRCNKLENAIKDSLKYNYRLLANANPVQTNADQRFSNYFDDIFEVVKILNYVLEYKKAVICLLIFMPLFYFISWISVGVAIASFLDSSAINECFALLIPWLLMVLELIIAAITIYIIIRVITFHSRLRPTKIEEL